MIPQQSIQSVQQSNRLNLKQSKLTDLPQFSCVTVHQLDCTFYGELNKSYQRQGFGILQTLDFDTYFGFWKNNKAEGLGLIVYNTGLMLYGHFLRNELFGPVILDDKKILKLMFFEGSQKVGLTYQYTYADALWRMISYQKGGKINVVREEHQPLQVKLPNMIVAQHTLNVFLSSYVSEQYFRDLDPQKIGKKEIKGASKKKQQPKKEELPQSKYSNLMDCLITSDNNTLWLGFKEEGHLHGIGCVYKKLESHLVQAGYYRKGLLYGFALKNEANRFKVYGCYEEGLKHGLFLQPGRENEIYSISEYHSDSFYKNHDMTEEAFKKRQKSYQYDQKDFLSAPNTFDLIAVKNVASGTKAPRKPLMETKQENFIFQRTKPTGMSQTRQTLPEKKKNSLISQEVLERTSLEIIRGKIMDFQLVSAEKEARTVSQEKRKGFVNSKSRIGDMQEDEESIAEEENPFNNALLGVNLINQSPSRRTY